MVLTIDFLIIRKLMIRNNKETKFSINKQEIVTK